MEAQGPRSCVPVEAVHLGRGPCQQGPCLWLLLLPIFSLLCPLPPMEVLSSSPPAVSGTSGRLNTNLIENETDAYKNFGPEIQSREHLARGWALESRVDPALEKPRGGSPQCPRRWRTQTCEHTTRSPHFPSGRHLLPGLKGNLLKHRGRGSKPGKTDSEVGVGSTDKSGPTLQWSSGQVNMQSLVTTRSTSGPSALNIRLAGDSSEWAEWVVTLGQSWCWGQWYLGEGGEVGTGGHGSGT